MTGYTQLIIAMTLFVGSHFLMSHPLRSMLVFKLGEKGFLGLYSLVSLGLFGWTIWAYSKAPAGNMLWAPTDAIWIAASVLTLLAAIFYAGSMVGNPAMPNPDKTPAQIYADKEPSGMLLVTRHPMMWGFAFWGIAHILVAPRTEVLIFVGSIIFLALAGAAAQDKRKAALAGAGWEQWAARTSYWPRLSRMLGIGNRLWLAGIAIWLVASWAHAVLGAPSAGIYRWL
jgi:uncharacterized membrane protein